MVYSKIGRVKAVKGLKLQDGPKSEEIYRLWSCIERIIRKASFSVMEFWMGESGYGAEIRQISEV